MLVIITATFPIDDTHEAYDALGALGRQILDMLGENVTVETSIVDDEAYVGVSYVAEDNEASRERAHRNRDLIERLLIDEQLDDVGVEPVLFA